MVNRQFFDLLMTISFMKFFHSRIIAFMHFFLIPSFPHSLNHSITQSLIHSFTNLPPHRFQTILLQELVSPAEMMVAKKTTAGREWRRVH